MQSFPYNLRHSLVQQTHINFVGKFRKSPVFSLEVPNPTGTIRHPSILEEAGVITVLGVHSNATSPLLTTVAEGFAPNLIEVLGEMQGHIIRKFKNFILQNR